MSIPLDPENNWKNKIADQILKDLLEINKLQGNSIKKMKADQNGVFYVEQEISVEEFLKTR
ncbi:hypothetical protein M5F03_14895 [Acinetobacter sp. ANC 5579]|uniref:Uncharacterized protein n=1 Tax=Acinetobacter chengduensis TaxID=2420890 RepID=A0ABX9TTT8_9GAMM|nr:MULTISPECIES: hypothetical protein [Acinetobacter]MCL6233156.1 hypothetical protein [Acinetobacter amyesii]MCL6236419.1 hypothetical protein [Acinetobacter amyesii]MCL6241828.1 hypothetical protein [Acinetobacter amyesii]RLL20175.1 hypothetical protein D9K81_12780 [Acinetobacter chengduensis]